jgi:Domain of unknown function (DUF4232)
MAGAKLAAVAAASLIALPAAALGGGHTATIAPCKATQLTGRFTVVPGSAGAGNISYALRLRNHSRRACFVSGLAGLRLLDHAHRPLPTEVEPAFRPGLTAVRVVLRPGRSARAEARLSPDVPGVGEPVAGTVCERTAYRVRVTVPPGKGTLVAPVTPPTPVCEHGRIVLAALSPIA